MKNLSSFIIESTSSVDCKDDFNALLELAKSKSSAKNIVGKYSSYLCDYLQFIRFDALDSKDYPNNIADNSAFIEFEIDYRAKKVEYHRGGHIWLSPADKKTDKYKYLAMRSMVSIAEEDGVKKFRKQGFKTTEDLFKKMENYYKSVMKSVEDYTGGYPYEKGIKE